MRDKEGISHLSPCQGPQPILHPRHMPQEPETLSPDGHQGLHTPLQVHKAQTGCPQKPGWIQGSPNLLSFFVGSNCLLPTVPPHMITPEGREITISCRRKASNMTLLPQCEERRGLSTRQKQRSREEYSQTLKQGEWCCQRYSLTYSQDTAQNNQSPRERAPRTTGDTLEILCEAPSEKPEKRVAVTR